MKRYYIIYSISFAVLLFLDQITKYFVISSMELGASIEVIPSFFDIRYIRNYGAVFGFLNNSDTDWQFWLFIVAMILAIGFLFSIVKSNPKNNYLWVASILILSGGIGNTIDRVQYRYVIDFLDFYIGTYHWPAFNLADCYIVLGIFFYIIEPYIASKKSKKVKNANS